MFHNLKNYGTELIMQELEKFDFETNDIPNGLEKLMSIRLDNKLVFIDSF